MRMFPQMRRGLFASDLALPELFHHLCMLAAFGHLQFMAVLFEKITDRIERGSLVSVHKSMVAGNVFGVAGCKLKRIRFIIGILVLWTCKSRFQEGGVSQTMRAATNFDHTFMDIFYEFTRNPLGFCQRFANSMSVLR